MKVSMLTTIDNPYDPFTQFEAWQGFDKQKGYNSSELLARTCVSIESLSEKVYQEQIEIAIDEILKNDLTQRFRRITKDV